MYRRRHRFQRPSKSPISTKAVFPKRAGRCAGCGLAIAPGTQCTQVRLMKKYRFPCKSCGKVPIGKRKYHDACVPSDLNLAMGFDPAVVAPPPSPSAYVRPAPAASVAPPPRPPTFNELALSALLALEKAMAFKVVPPEKKKEVEAAIAKYKLIKARALRPGTPAEGEVATSLAIQALIKTVFNA